MYRLFVGIDLPDIVRQKLTGLMGGIVGARWQRDDQLHLTLRFIGEVDANRANDIADALQPIRHPAFDIGIDGTGTFDRRGRIDSLWARVEPADAIRALHNKIDRALGRIGIDPDTRSYTPHITLARFSHGAGPMEGFMHASGGVRAEPFRVDSFCLFESRLTAAGANYTIAERYDFAR